MKKTLIAMAVVTAGFVGSAQAALVTVPFTYLVNFVDSTVAAELDFARTQLPGQPPSTFPALPDNTLYFTGSFTYEDTLAPIDGGYVAGDPSAPNSNSFSLQFGPRSFTQADDISGFGVSFGVGPTNNLTALSFETLFNLTGSGAGEYLLSFSGTQAQLTPSGNTTDFSMTASAVPLPAALPLLLAGLSVMGYIGRRRRLAES